MAEKTSPSSNTPNRPVVVDQTAIADMTDEELRALAKDIVAKVNRRAQTYAHSRRGNSSGGPSSAR